MSRHAEEPQIEIPQQTPVEEEPQWLIIPNVETLKRGYDAFAKGDMETLRSELFQPGIVWHQGGNNPTAGEYRGAEQVLRLFGNLFETTGGTFRVHLTNIVGDGDQLVPGRSVWDGRQIARRGSAPLGVPYR